MLLPISREIPYRIISPEGEILLSAQAPAGIGISSPAHGSFLATEDGHVYLAQDSVGDRGYTDALVIKFDPFGIPLWTRTAHLGRHDSFKVALLYPDESVAAVGEVQPRAWDWDLLAQRYQPDGTLVWERRYSGPLGGRDDLHDAQMDREGNLYLLATCGALEGSPYGGVVMLVKLSPGGGILWESRYPPAPYSGARAKKLLMDESRQAAYVLMETSPRVVKYNLATGAEEWRAEYPPPPESAYAYHDITMDEWGNLYIVGAGKTTPWEDDTDVLFVVRIDPAGNVRWRYDIPPATRTENLLHPVAKNNALYCGETRLFKFRIPAMREDGDLTGDGTVDDGDLTLVIEHYGSDNSLGDVNSDGMVDDGDLVTVVENYGFGFDRNDGRGVGLDMR